LGSLFVDACNQQGDAEWSRLIISIDFLAQILDARGYLYTAPRALQSDSSCSTFEMHIVSLALSFLVIAA
jgi:hypothetical protein